MKERNNNLSYLRALACIAVIIIHSVSIPAAGYSMQISQLQLIASNTVVNLMMWSIPAFLMVSGALLLDPDRQLTYKKLWSKYILRIALIMLIFSLVYKLCDICWSESLSFSAAEVLDFIPQLFEGSGWQQMWYLYLLTGLYLLLPFYKMVAEKSSAADMKYFLAVQLVFLSLLPVLKLFGIECGFYIQTFTIYLFYLFCGAALYTGKLRIPRRAAAAMITAGAAGIVLATRYAVLSGKDMSALTGYSSIFTVMLAASLFSLAVNSKRKIPGSASRFLLEIDGCSLGIYMVHIIFVKWIIAYRHFNPYEHNAIISYAVIVAASLLLSYAAVKLLKKIKYLSSLL